MTGDGRVLTPLKSARAAEEAAAADAAQAQPVSARRTSLTSFLSPKAGGLGAGLVLRKHAAAPTASAAAAPAAATGSVDAASPARTASGSVAASPVLSPERCQQALEVASAKGHGTVAALLRRKIAEEAKSNFERDGW